MKSGKLVSHSFMFDDAHTYTRKANEAQNGENGREREREREKGEN